MFFILFFSISTLSLFFYFPSRFPCLLLYSSSFPPCFSRLMFLSFSFFFPLHLAIFFSLIFLFLSFYFLSSSSLSLTYFLPYFPSPFSHLIRFIELMPFDGNEWSREKFVGYLEVLHTLQSNGINLVRESSEKEDPHGK